MKRRPEPAEYAADFQRYVSRVPEVDILAALELQAGEVREALARVPGGREGYRYEPGKWSIREVVGHFLDAERVFGCRALCIARGDTTSLPGFDEGEYAKKAGHDRVPLASLLAEFESLRESHELMLTHLEPAAWNRIGTANGHPVSARALAYIMVGHVRHHLAVLESRYGVGASAI